MSGEVGRATLGRKSRGCPFVRIRDDAVVNLFGCASGGDEPMWKCVSEDYAGVSSEQR